MAIAFSDYWQRFVRKLEEYKRVFIVTRKPDMNEFKTIVKVSGLGIAAIGFVGFLIFFIREILLR